MTIPLTSATSLTFQQSAILVESLQSLTKINDGAHTMPTSIETCVKDFVKAQAKFVKAINTYMHDKHVRLEKTVCP